MNYAIKQKYRAAKPEIRLQSLQEVWTFDTYATFYENGQFINLASRYDANGIRAIASNKNSTLETSLKKMQRFYIARFKKMANSFMDIFLLMIVIYGTIIRYVTVLRFTRF